MDPSESTSGIFAQCERPHDGSLSCRTGQTYQAPYEVLVPSCGNIPTHLSTFTERSIISQLAQADEKLGIQTQSVHPPELSSTDHIFGCTTASSRLVDGWDDPITRMHVCQWADQGILCGETIRGNKRNIALHLYRRHNIPLGAHKMQQECRWLNCSRVMQRESISRHIHTVHLRERARCSCGCGLFFARSDSLRRHLKKLPRAEANLA